MFCGQMSPQGKQTLGSVECVAASNSKCVTVVAVNGKQGIFPTARCGQMDMLTFLYESRITNCSPQELERLEVERVEMIRQHLCQYTTLRHETDMFNQSVSTAFYTQYKNNDSMVTL